MDNHNHGLKGTLLRRQVVPEGREGVYIWRVMIGDDGRAKYLSDGNDHFLMIRAEYGDEEAQRKLAKEAAACGVDQGQPVFIPGHRPVTDDEWEEQRMRFELGLEPDPVVAARRKNV